MLRSPQCAGPAAAAAPGGAGEVKRLNSRGQPCRSGVRTNQFALPPATICALYKSRWQVELFFKWIKQHLRIKKFYGTSENAVKTQIWIAVSVYVLVAIVKKRLGLDASLYTLLQILSLTLFEKMPILQALSQAEPQIEQDPMDNQLKLLMS